MTDTQWAAALLREGYTALAKGNIAGANKAVRAILTRDRRLPDGHFLFGLVALQSGKRGLARQAFASVLELVPDHVPALAQLAHIAASLGQMQAATARLEQARGNLGAGTDAATLDLFGKTAAQLGDHVGALEFYQHAAQKAPEHNGFAMNIASSLVFLGELEAARAKLDLILQEWPDTAEAHWLRASITRATRPEDAAQLLMRAKQETVPEKAAFLAYASGKYAEDVQEWGAAFEAFSYGAKARRHQVKFDEPREIALFEALENTFTREWFDAAPIGDPNHGPIFILGQPRTGTTLIERILTAHSQVHSAGELQQFGRALQNNSRAEIINRFDPAAISGFAQIPPAQLGGAYFENVQNQRGNAPYFVDKLPNNFLFLPLILKALPNAKIIHLTRHPMDACWASFKQLFADAYFHSYDQGEMARHHLRYLQLMRVWRERFGAQFLDISYEDTVADLEPNARKLISFVGLEWESACLDFHAQAGAVATASAAQVREKPHTRSVGRWREYGELLAPMIAELKKVGVAL